MVTVVSRMLGKNVYAHCFLNGFFFLIYMHQFFRRCDQYHLVFIELFCSLKDL